MSAQDEALAEHLASRVASSLPDLWRISATATLRTALEREELELERALAAQLASAKPAGPSLPYCATCGDEIPAKRRALGGVTRCTPCQTLFEKRATR